MVSSPIDTDLVVLTSYMWFGNAWPFDPQRLKFLLAHEFLGEVSSYETSGRQGSEERNKAGVEPKLQIFTGYLWPLQI